MDEGYRHAGPGHTGRKFGIRLDDQRFRTIVGGASLADGQFDAFLWDGRMHDLGALNGCAYAWAINARAQVVGNWGGSQCDQGAFLWENGGPMVDLSTLVSSTTGLSLAGVIEINDRGEIVGSACVEGNCYAALLVPCDENHRGIEDCDYNLVDATAAQVRAPAGRRGLQKTIIAPAPGIRERLNGRVITGEASGGRSSNN